MEAPKIFSMKLAAASAAFFLALAAGGAMARDSSPHDKLAAWVGHWKVRIETKKTQFSSARTDDYDAKCSFLPNGTFLACEYLSLQPDPNSGRTLNDVALLYYSSVGKTFKYTNIAPEGGPREDVMHVDGNVWVRPYEYKAKTGRVIDAREIYTFVSADKQLARLEQSTDKGTHWTVVNEAVGTKAQSP